MAKEIMDRRASDNVYLHKDFHGALSVGIDFLHQRYGSDSVREYLRQFTLACYAPLKEKLAKEGFPALKEYFEEVYAAEGEDIDIELTDNELVVSVRSCPAVAHMRAHGYKVAELFYETVRTVNESLCEGTPFSAELDEYDETTGRSVQRFFRRN